MLQLSRSGVNIEVDKAEESPVCVKPCLGLGEAVGIWASLQHAMDMDRECQGLVLSIKLLVSISSKIKSPLPCNRTAPAALFFADSFTRQVLWTLMNDVKFGEAISYKQLADLAGNSRAARAVGGAMRSNPIPIIIPCHRVIRSSGETGNYGGGRLLKEWLLSHEKLQKEKLAY
ncbi:hypothetical protein BTVI_104446 [Pitangus sulphuratus]|nr:hypothetical protein BTVI_104446 [Pitangus sulphuratus]